MSNVKTKYAFCCECRDDKVYRLEVRKQYYTHPVSRTTFPYQRKACICVECGSELFVPTYHDENINNIRKGYERICKQN